MDFGDSPAEAGFRLRLRRWLTDNDPGLPASSTDDAYWAGQAAWHQALYDGGFFGLSWPVEIGGGGLPSVYDVILDEELADAGAPPWPGLGYLVQGLLRHGSAEIQRRFLPGLVNGRERWCQGFSEPEAGSDLAALRTRAEGDGDEYVLHGHKVWTSYSDDATWCLTLARTDPDAPRHKGISAFVVAMDQPGVERRPLRMINGVTKEFGEVVFDGARVPAAAMVGGPGEGWALAMTVVGHEREPGELGYVARYRKAVKELTRRRRRRARALRRRGASRPGVVHHRDRHAAPPREPPALRPPRRHRPRPRRLGRQAAHDLDRGHRRPGGPVDRWCRPRRGGRHLAPHLPLRPGPERHGRHVADPAQPDRPADPRPPDVTVEDELRLHRLLSEYCQRIDDADFGAVASLFTEDGSFTFGAETATGRAALAEWFAANQPPHRRGKHLSANPIVDVEGDRADVSSDFAFVRFIRGALTTEVVGRYVDRCVRVDGTWLIATRVCEVLTAPPDTR